MTAIDILLQRLVMIMTYFYYLWQTIFENLYETLAQDLFKYIKQKDLTTDDLLGF